jgi:hypothetical protein
MVESVELITSGEAGATLAQIHILSYQWGTT